MVNVVRGDIVLCNLNPVKGTEQAGIRPTVIVQCDRANQVSPHTIIAPVTSKLRAVLLPSHVFVPATIGGLDRDSVILCEQIRVIDKSRILRIIGHLEDEYIESLDRALCVILDLAEPQEIVDNS